MDTETDYFSNIAHSMPNIADKIIDKFKFNSKLAFRPNEIPQLTKSTRTHQHRRYGIK